MENPEPHQAATESPETTDPEESTLLLSVQQIVHAREQESADNDGGGTGRSDYSA